MSKFRNILAGVILFTTSCSGYVVKDGICISTPQDGPHVRYDAGLVYGGNEARFRRAAELYKTGYLAKIIPLDDEKGMRQDIKILIENGVPERDIIPPKGSVDTLTNMVTGYEAARKNGDLLVANISDSAHLRRIDTIGKITGLIDGNDGFFGVNSNVSDSSFKCAGDSVRSAVYRTTGIVIPVK
ncbi:MAG: YdcF family protein [Candidatus Aenigmarchaeota archaeon]|nr:YdcF family protein [Candidatus Aenigmarchaeota archaeon]